MGKIYRLTRKIQIPVRLSFLHLTFLSLLLNCILRIGQIPLNLWFTNSDTTRLVPWPCSQSQRDHGKCHAI
ncbi:hypothetical protein F5883DRAFT_587525 [Diaporthe sp. PMI_573]|nr:hypothetical protein F5883DRAFT_587525 [Diaporthaceae sp. PMI_573]